jgi:hypothetical protein
MISALGVSQNRFNPADPGRLCRGRERWIEPWETDLPPDAISRLVVSGALFTDASARDARRGLPFSGVDLAQLIVSLFPRRRMIAFMEDGHPADVPDDAEGLEAYPGYRSGGRSEEVMVRWYREVSGIKDLRVVFGTRKGEALPPEPGEADRRDEDRDLAIAAGERVRGFLVIDGDLDDAVMESLLEPMFLLVGMSTLDSPPARFQPAALPELLGRVRAVILLHRDKHGPALGVYTREPLEVGDRVRDLCEKAGALYVPFAIPPMLARWDRALSDLREVWSPDRGEFPVPAAPESPRWEGRRRRRGGPVEEQELPPMEEESVVAEGGDPIDEEPAAEADAADEFDDDADEEVDDPGDDDEVDDPTDDDPE